VVNINKLRGKIVERELNIAELADKIGIDRATLYRKLNSGGENFSVKEVDLMAKVLHLTLDEAVSIFFSQYVS
jgi:DNA-binding phage protein